MGEGSIPRGPCVYCIRCALWHSILRRKVTMICINSLNRKLLYHLKQQAKAEIFQSKQIPRLRLLSIMFTNFMLLANCVFIKPSIYNAFLWILPSFQDISRALTRPNGGGIYTLATKYITRDYGLFYVPQNGLSLTGPPMLLKFLGADITVPAVRYRCIEGLWVHETPHEKKLMSTMNKCTCSPGQSFSYSQTS